MKIIDFLDEIKKNCSEITHLCIEHTFKKIYTNIHNDTDDKKNLLDIIENYPLLLKYLNDYAGVIYRKYNSSTQEIYMELCNYFNLEVDNKYTLEQVITKLQKQTPSLLMSLVDEDIKIKTIKNFEEKLENIKNSTYYKKNKIKLESIVNKLENNIKLVKRASNL